MAAPKTSISPKARPSLDEQTKSIIPDIRPKKKPSQEEIQNSALARQEEEALQRMRSEEFGDLEFRYTLDKQLRKNPLARLGYENKHGDKVADLNDVTAYLTYVFDNPELKTQAMVTAGTSNENEAYYRMEKYYLDNPEIFDNAFYFPSDMTKQSLEKKSLKYAFPQERVKELFPDDILTDVDDASPRIWSHEMTHRGFDRLVEYKNQIGKEAFKEKYGEKALKTLEGIHRDTGKNEFFTEYLDDLDESFNYPNKNKLATFTKGRSKFLDVNTESNIDRFQKDFIMSGYNTNKRSNKNSYGGLGNLLVAAQDVLKAQGEPPKAEPIGFLKKLRNRLGLSEGGDVSTQMDLMLPSADDDIRPRLPSV